MSRVGNRIISITDGVKVSVDGNNIVTINGPKGELKKEFSSLIKIKIEGNEIKTERSDENKQTKMLHGTTNSLISNMIVGVTKGFEKVLEIIGIGYNVKLIGQDNLQFSLGLSHKVDMKIPLNLKAEIVSPTELKISGIDNQKVGEFAAKIKALRKPEPYGGKGIRYKGEYIIRKAGKTSK